MRKAICAIALAVLAAGCAGTSNSSGTASQPVHAASAIPGVTPAATTTGPPCNPTASDCWVPAVGEQFMSYRSPKRYTDARVLARDARCTVLPGGSFGRPGPVHPNRHAAGCGFGGATEGDGLSEAMIFRSWPAEAAMAGQMAQAARADDTADYAVVGPGWILGTITQVTDAIALQAQQVTGGEVVCFPGYDNSMSSC